MFWIKVQIRGVLPNCQKIPKVLIHVYAIVNHLMR